MAVYKSRFSHPPRWILALGAAVGLGSFVYYKALGLTTAHYDAKAHLVVARRLVDSLEPGYLQMGIHWLPLIHLLYLPLVRSDSQYQSAFLPSLISVAAFALSGWLVFRISRRSTGSTAAGVFASLLLLGNANLQYLQSCPLTEPLYIMLLLLAVDTVTRWREGENPSLPCMAGLWIALGALCRYEGWLFAIGVILLLAMDFWTGRIRRSQAAKSMALVAVCFALPVLVHFAYLYFRVGDSFVHRVARGNPAPYETFHRPFLSLVYHLGELSQVAAILPMLLGLAGLAWSLRSGGPAVRLAPLYLLWIPSLVNIAAFYWGMLYRVRYSILLVPAIAIFGSLQLVSQRALRTTFTLACVAAMTLPWISWYFPREWKYHLVFPGPGILLLPAAALICLLVSRAGAGERWPLLALCLFAMQVPALSGEDRPIIPETLEHRFLDHEREAVLNHLRSQYDGTRILIDMEKLAPLVYDSRLPVKEFIYREGGGNYWRQALDSPSRVAGWLCSQKGDVVWHLLQVDPQWVDGYSLAVKTENFLLYRLRAEAREVFPPRRSE
jgi:Dolichyl-phosphate-mannose-protein mannosyltransferase